MLSFRANSYSIPEKRIRNLSWFMDFFRALIADFSFFSTFCRTQFILQLAVISSGLISASNSSVMRVTSLLGELRARRPLPFFEESHFRFTKVTWQSEQGAPPPNALFRTISSCLPFIRGCRWHLASLILKEAFCLIGAVTVSTQGLLILLNLCGGPCRGIGVPQLTV